MKHVTVIPISTSYSLNVNSVERLLGLNTYYLQIDPFSSTFSKNLAPLLELAYQRQKRHLPESVQLFEQPQQDQLEIYILSMIWEDKLPIPRICFGVGHGIRNALWVQLAYKEFWYIPYVWGEMSKNVGNLENINWEQVDRVKQMRFAETSFHAKFIDTWAKTRIKAPTDAYPHSAESYKLATVLSDYIKDAAGLLFVDRVKPEMTAISTLAIIIHLYSFFKEISVLPQYMMEHEQQCRERYKQHHKLEPASSGYIYLVQAISPDSYFKIGLSKNPIKRIKSMGVKLPFPLEILRLIPTNHTYKAEKMLHDKYADKRVEGEWFELSSDDVAEICAESEILIGGIEPVLP